ncbi:hypothetical protein NSK_002746 [Nannochloropsis salina CCMP1776]|uniref:VPS9 domain-containing protein n=1 Tax=Nannochloropsis salina CCMP1776 TaxID=1027361 RepID=A0A4D9D3E4_9STRA|nr:hypothetical protein NSK_002746 [Nannochloropsis salina CCMP1776]|eukprot:TFJ85926.1 hypothetical protein NSK_002746 [Nannochloropsis salina CCMP1776]
MSTGSIDESRRHDLLLEARRQRLSWLQNEDYVEMDVVEVFLAKQQEEQQQHGKEQGSLAGLFQEVPGLANVLPAAREYVGFLNEVAGEDDRDAVAYDPNVLQALSAAQDGETWWLEEAEAEPATPLPDESLDPSTPLSYDGFIRLLMHPGSAEIVKSMQRFVSAFIQSQERRKGLPARAPPSPSSPRPQGEHLHAFIDSLRGELCKNKVWSGRLTAGGGSRASGSWSAAWEEVREHLEKFLVIKLHRYLFTEAETQVLVKEEARWRARVQSLAFLGPEHLEVRSLLSSSSVSAALAPAILEFSRVPAHKAPADIMAGLLRCSQALTQALVSSRVAGAGLPGADEFLPAMILTVKESNPKNLRRAIHAVQRYRHPSRLQVAEPAYVFTNVLSAIHFLETADASQLNMTPESFATSVAACKAASGGLSWTQERGLMAEIEDGEDRPLVDLPGPASAPPPSVALSSPLQNLSTARGPLAPSSTFARATGRADLLSSPLPGSPGKKASPWLFRSIQNVRRERELGSRRAPALTAMTPPAPLQVAACRLQELVKDLQEHASRRLEKDCSQGSRSQEIQQQTPLPPSVSSQRLLKSCSFLHASSLDLRMSDISALLAEYRCLVAVADQCLELLQHNCK